MQKYFQRLCFLDFELFFFKVQKSFSKAVLTSFPTFLSSNCFLLGTEVFFPSFLGTELFLKFVSVLGAIYPNIFAVFCVCFPISLCFLLLYQMFVFSATEIFSRWLPPDIMCQEE